MNETPGNPHDHDAPAFGTAPATPLPGAPGAPGAPGEITTDDRNFAMLAHLLGAFTSFVGPLVIWLLKKDAPGFAQQEARESLNFQLTVLIAYAVATAVAVVTCGIGAVLFPVLAIFTLVMCILAALKGKEGIAYRYPFTLRLVK